MEAIIKLFTIILNAIGLRIEGNNTIKENENAIEPAITYNGKPILVDYDSTKSIINNFIVLKIESSATSCTYHLLQKYMTKVLNSKVNSLVLKLITLAKSPELQNKIDNERLNKFLFKLYDKDDFGIEDIIEDSTQERFSKILKNRSLENFLIKLNLKYAFVEIKDKNILQSQGIPEPRNDVSYTCTESYINASFPIYELLLNIKNNKLFGIELDKKDVDLLIKIFQYLFENIDDDNAYNFINNPRVRETSNKDKKSLIVEGKPLQDTLNLIKGFLNISKKINKTIDELFLIDDINIKKLDIDLVEEIICLLEEEQYFPKKIDFETKNDGIAEIRKSKHIALKSLNDTLNKEKSEDKIKISKPNKSYSNKRVSYPRQNNFLGSSMVAAKFIPRFDSKELTLDITDESFAEIIPKDFKFSSAYMAAGAGSGKSEGLKVLALKDIQDESKNFILIDGGEKLALELVKLVPPERLVFLDESLNEGHCFSINPLDEKDKSDKSLSSRSKHLAKSFELLLDGSWSDNMEAVLVPIIYVLMYTGGYDIFDLKRFMDKENYDELKKLALKCPNKTHSDFIINDLHRIKSVKQTLDAVFMKLQNLLSDDSLTKCISGKSTIDFEKMINEPAKIIICKIDSSILGIFLVAMIQGIAEKRDVHNFIHTNLYIDEFQDMVSPSSTKILNKLRKKGLHLTMANQDLEDIKEIRSNVFANTNVKVAGKNSYENSKIMAKELGINVKELENLGVGEFYIKVGTQDAVKVKITDKYIDQNGAMSDDDWQKVVELQLSKYYNEINHRYKVQTSLSIGSNNEIVFSPENDEF